MTFRSDAGRIMLIGGSSVFGPAQDASLQAGVMRDTWEHPDPSVAPGPIPGSVTIQSLGIISSSVLTVPNGGSATGTITLSAPAPAEGATVQLAMALSPPEAAMWISLSATQITIPANSITGRFSISCALDLSQVGLGQVTVVVTATLGASSTNANVTFR